MGAHLEDSMGDLACNGLFRHLGHAPKKLCCVHFKYLLGSFDSSCDINSAQLERNIYLCNLSRMILKEQLVIEITCLFI